MASGIWEMDEEGNFTLDSAYRRALDEVRFAASDAWFAAMAESLAGKTRYTPEELKQSFSQRCLRMRSATPDVAESFILDALTGDL